MEVDKLIALLSIVIEDELDSDFAEGLCNKLNWSAMPDLDEVHSNLFHYWHDEDIRQKDADYNKMQKDALAKLIKYLKQGEFNKASAISFLSTE